MTSSSDGNEHSAAGEVRAIVVGHGSYAEGMIDAVDRITGRGHLLLGVSNRDLSAGEIETRLRECTATTGVKVFFSDLPAGSATLAVRRLLRDHTDCVLVTGANLAALLDFVFQPPMSAVDAAHHAAEKGRLAVLVNGGAS